MTFETQCFVLPADIIGIELECSKCGYRWIRPVDNWIQDGVNCGNCGEVWFIKNGSDLTNLKNLVSALRAISELTKKPLPFSIRFEVKCPAK